MVLQPFPREEGVSLGWRELGLSAPTLLAFAQLCGRSLSAGTADEPLRPEAYALLFAARKLGVLELKAVNTAYEAAERLLAVYVDLDHDRTMVFRSREDVEVTLRFLDGFRQLCSTGLVMHHIYGEFSLTAAGFEAAKLVEQADVEQLLAQATEFGLNE
ncbi:MAG: hypothetical protein QGG36_29860 [Pirellulaceae bacterium]|jgi:hypothetical protein|nr:hypothetical protein [Pirellulaceae bacterium]